MNRFYYDSPQLQPGEEQLSKAYNTKLYDGDTKTGFEGGDVLLTSYRLQWSATSDFSSRDSICLALPLYFVVYIEEDAQSAFSFRSSHKLIIHLAPVPEGSKRPGPVEVSLNNYIKVSFKNGLDSSFIYSFKEAVQLRKWESRPVVPNNPSFPSSKLGIKPRTGIIGIERGIQEKQKATDSSISAAFQDLTKLMAMAKDMVNIAKNVSNKIRERQGNVSDDETVQFKSYLLSLGIDDPVTRDSAPTESQYIERLAQQLVDILIQPIEEQGGMMSLADCYCRVNRARGLELLSPEDLLRAARLTNRLDLPLRLHQFDSGAMVLQLSSHSDEAIATDTSQILKEKGSLSSEELAQTLGIPVQLAKERLITTEKFGKACRDESIQGLNFYPNLFLDK